MNPIRLALITAAFQAQALHPDHERRMVTVYPPKPKGTHADHERIAAAQAKRERRAKRMLEAVRNAPPNSRVAELDGKPVFFSVNAEQEWLDNHRDLTADEEAEAQAACSHPVKTGRIVGNGHDIDQEHLAWLNKMLFGSDQP